MKTLFLDLGGTLVDIRPNYHEPIFAVLRSRGYNVSLRDVYRAISKYLGDEGLEMREGNPVLDMRKILSILDSKCAADRDLLKELEAISFKATDWSLYDDTLEFLTGAKVLGYRLYIVSNASRNIYNILESLKIRKYFDGVIASFEVGAMKPSPIIFAKAVEAAGEAGPYIGDLYEVDYLGAKRSGFRPVLLDRHGFYHDLSVVKAGNLHDVLKMLKNGF